MKVVFATGNASKFYEASAVCQTMGIELEQATVDIDEIQHHDSVKITEAKVRAAYDTLGRPVVVNDSSWEIPALGGFPGGYMKDVAAWLQTEDFSALMANKEDKSIHLKEYVAFYDGETLNIFTHQRVGHFLDSPRGQAPPSFARLVQMDSDDMTISEIFDKGNWDTSNPDEYKHWYDFASWYAQSKNNKGENNADI